MNVVETSNQRQLIEHQYDSCISLVLSRGQEIGEQLLSWSSDPDADGDVYGILLEESEEWRRKSKYLIYPIREAVLLKGIKAIPSPDLAGETELTYIIELLKDWIVRLTELGIELLINEPNVLFNGTDIMIDPNHVKKLYEKVLPNITAISFLSDKSTLEIRSKQSKMTGTGTFLDIFAAFINSVRCDNKLTTVEERRQSLKDLSVNGGEMYKLMSIGIAAVLEIEENHIIPSSHVFRESIASDVPHANHYLKEGTRREITQRRLTDVNRQYLKKCPAAAALLLIVSKIVDALDDDFFMLQPEG